METKFIITKDGRHFKSDWKHHSTIARDNGYDGLNDIIECGIFLDKQMFIMECDNLAHIKKHKERYVGNCLNEFQDNRLKAWIKGRELESFYYYGKKAVGVLPEGD